MINEYFVKKYCNEDISRIENFDKAIADKYQIWDCHHRREMTTPKKELLEIGEYFNRPANELVFITQKEHRALHNKGKQLSEETKQKISIAHQGKTPWNKGVPSSDETKKKISSARKGMVFSEEHKKNLSESLKGKNTWSKGRSWFNNGTISVIARECPEGFVRGMLKRKAI